MPAINVHDKAFEIFLSEREIQKRIAELAADINRDYEGKRPLVYSHFKRLFHVCLRPV